VNEAFLYAVSRLIGVGEQFEMDLILDVNTFLYPLNKDDKFTLALAPKLSLREGVQDSAYFDQVRIASQNYQALLDRRTMQGHYGIIFKVSVCARVASIANHFQQVQ
jgi:hypothetical protein